MEWEAKLEMNGAIRNTKDATLIVGVPGVGNVGMIVLKYLINNLKPTKMYTFFSYCLPNSAYVTPDQTVRRPELALYHKRIGKRDYFFLTGDVQPIESGSSYAFVDKVLNIAKIYKVTTVLSICGIGIPAYNKDRIGIHCTGNNLAAIGKIADVYAGVNTNVYGLIGPIAGVSGVMLTSAARYGMDSVCLLGESSNQPMFFAVETGVALLKLVDKIFGFGLNNTVLDKELGVLRAEVIEAAVAVRQPDNKEAQTYMG